MRASPLLIAPVLALAVTAPTTGRPQPPRRASLEALAVEAEGVEPEFSADVLIRVAQAVGPADPAWTRELLERAFVRAYAAQQPYRRTAGPQPADTRQLAEAIAADVPLDTVTLQTRAVQLLRFVDAVRARELFGWIAVAPASDSCETSLVPAVDDYYQALAVLAADSFPADRDGRADATNFFQAYLWRARLPSEMPALAKAVRRFRRSWDEAVYFEAVLHTILTTSDRDARGFSTSGLDIITRFTELEKADAELGVSGSHLTLAVRQYLIGQLSNARCADSVAEGQILSSFNSRVSPQLRADGVDPIDPNVARTAKIQGAVQFVPLWQTPAARRLHDDWMALRGTGRDPVPMRIRQSADWQRRADLLVTQLEDWSSLHEPNARDHFFQKGVLFVGLVELVPPGEVRVRVLRSFAEFLRRSDAGGQRLLWFAIANRLIERTRSSEAAQAVEILQESHHPVLAIYAHAAQLLPIGARPSAAP